MTRIFHILGGWLCFCLAAHAASPFTVADDIELITFGSPALRDPRIRFSPDRKYVAVWSERGRIATNAIEDTVRVYRTHDVETHLRTRESGDTEVPPVRTFTRSGEEAPVIGEWRWLPDSSGIAFSEGAPYSCKRVYVYELDKSALQPMTDATECVGYFDVHDTKRYVYSRAVPRRDPADESFIVGTGRSLMPLLFPHDPRKNPADGQVVSVVDGRRIVVTSDNAPIVRSAETKSTNKELVLSPDGKSLVTATQIDEVPARWPQLYPPPFPNAPFQIQPGRPADRFIRIDVETGRSEPLIDAPTADTAAWWHLISGWGNRTSLVPLWSKDSSAVLLPGVFVPTADGTPSRPCVAVVERATGRASCVHRYEIPNEQAPSQVVRMFREMSFVEGDARRVRLKFDLTDGSHTEVEYRQSTDGTWAARGKVKSRAPRGELTLRIQESLDEPPVVIAEQGGRSGVLWDPNPRLKERFDLGRAEVYRWKTPDGREWTGGLYTPPQSFGRGPFPLVIQTHGFDPEKFAPSGWEPMGFAARALQSAGILVLQVGELCTTPSLDEAHCATAGYAAAVRQLSAEGRIDPQRVGIIGFSRTCIYVMNALTQNELPLAAALLTDGLMSTYVQQILMQGIENDVAFPGGFDTLIGAAPFGAGLKTWLERSPGFNLDRIHAPVRVVGQGAASLLFMWEPYAGLRYLNKPTDLVLLNAKLHNPLNPGVRLASQGGAVDWFRFWLEHEEDPSPEKVSQYVRWRALSAGLTLAP